MDTTDTGSEGDIGSGDSNTFALDTTDSSTGGDTGTGDSNTFPLDTTDSGTGGDTASADSNNFTLDTTDSGTGGDTGTGDSNIFPLDTTDSGTGGDTAYGNSNTFTLDTTRSGTGGDTGSGDSNIFPLDTTEKNTPPYFVSNDYFSVIENHSFVGNIHAIDKDGESLHYSITDGYDQDWFEINASSGALTFISPPDYEKPWDHDFDNNYELLISASDGKEEAFLLLTIEVEDLDDTAPVLELLGDEYITHEAGFEYKDRGAVWSDKHDGFGSADANGTVNTKVPGKYTINYFYTDSSGNDAQAIQRIIEVVDTTPPVTP